MTKTLAGLTFVSLLFVGISNIAASPAQAATTKYANCTALNKTYPYGVAAKGAKDKVTSNFYSVTTFTTNTAVYTTNSKLDTDKDKIACELPYYKTCKLLNGKYLHGVAKAGAVDSVKGTTHKVTNFTVYTALYNINKPKLDADKDGIACEK